jgi:predicted ester cyclase
MLEATEKRGFAAQADFFAERVLNHGIPISREDIRAVCGDIQQTFPNARLEPLTIVAEDDWVVVRAWLVGTHTGMGQHPFVHNGWLAGVPPTGRSMNVLHIHMFRFSGGEIVEHWAARDDAGMMRQLGLTVPPAAEEKTFTA